jgi:HEAT repeat protein
MRHLLGHLLISCWIKASGIDKYLPRWVFAGAGHWLSRRPEMLSDMASFCAGEGSVISDDGQGWVKKAQQYASRRKSRSLQSIFDVTSIGGVDLECHIRSWSLFELLLAEDRERFLAFLAELRDGAEEREALQRTMGISTDELEQRWRDRVLGKRRSMAPTPEELDAANPEEVGAKLRAGLREETDDSTLASRLRAILAIDDPLTAATIVELLRRESDLVRETAVMVLARKPSDAVRAWLRTEGLARTGGYARAEVVRVLGDLRDEASRPALTDLRRDSNWLTRANVARALALLGGEPSVGVLRGLLEDGNPKVVVAALDALAAVGRPAREHWSAVSDHLGDRAWQARSAAAACLGALGEMRAIEPLIARMELESGRLHRDIHDALKRLSGDDLGEKPAHWRAWWDEEKVRLGEGERPPPPRREPPPGYGEVPTYFGLRVYSERIAYVLDISASMAHVIDIDPEWMEKNRRAYPQRASKYTLARHEVTASLQALDPRAMFNLYFFRSDVTSWKPKLARASPRVVEAAIGRMNAVAPPDGGGGVLHRTNYVDVFRRVLGTGKDRLLEPRFAETPDTMFFLTDGLPTVGDITETATLLAWFRERNRFARVRCNVIVFGRTGLNEIFLKALTEGNGGTLVQVPRVGD